MKAAIALTFAALVAAAALPASPVVWLRPAELPRPGSRVNVWPNAVAGSRVVGATLDKTRCCLGGELCSSAPVVGVIPSGVRVVNFTGPGPNGLGNNLIIAGNYSTLNTSYSVFFASSTAPGVAGQRILGKAGAGGEGGADTKSRLHSASLGTRHRVQGAGMRIGSSARGGRRRTM